MSCGGNNLTKKKYSITALTVIRMFYSTKTQEFTLEAEWVKLNTF